MTSLRRRFRGVDLAEIANLPVTTLLRDRNGIAQLRRIDSDESPAMLVHDSPSLFEALPRPIRVTLAVT
jgi:hypothetical protein